MRELQEFHLSNHRIILLPAQWVAAKRSVFRFGLSHLLLYSGYPAKVQMGQKKGFSLHPSPAGGISSNPACASLMRKRKYPLTITSPLLTLSLQILYGKPS